MAQIIRRDQHKGLTVYGLADLLGVSCGKQRAWGRTEAALSAMLQSHECRCHCILDSGGKPVAAHSTECKCQNPVNRLPKAAV